ncbi:MAG: alanyl-tRNA editing protein [Deltaproteobacteria bacterium]|nr:alanyl-tRNA editing protein [Deltaproteobacteria bacterium]
MPPVEKIFWEDPYLSELKAMITSVSKDMVTLDRTIFYAASGGQEADTGTIGGVPVSDAQKQGTEIFYTLQCPHGFDTGDEVLVRIDWERRYCLMRLHFAAEIILELVYRSFNRPEKIGANISADKARLDFLWDGRISDAFPVLEAEAKKLIGADLPIVSAYSDRGQEKRFWEIEGFAKVSCGGTHVKRTGEVGSIRLRRNNIGKGKERIEITLG